MDFPVQLRPGGVSRGADDTDDLPGCNLLADGEVWLDKTMVAAMDTCSRSHRLPGWPEPFGSAGVQPPEPPKTAEMSSIGTPMQPSRTATMRAVTSLVMA